MDPRILARGDAALALPAQLYASQVVLLRRIRLGDDARYRRWDQPAVHDVRGYARQCKQGYTCVQRREERPEERDTGHDGFLSSFDSCLPSS